MAKFNDEGVSTWRLSTVAKIAAYPFVIAPAMVMFPASTPSP